MLARCLMIVLALTHQCLVYADVSFTPVQPDLFGDPRGQTNAWGDFDGDFAG